MVFRFKSRRQTIKLDEAKCYQPLLATSLFQYFREDLGGISAVSFAEDTGIIATAFYSGELKVGTVKGQDSVKGRLNVVGCRTVEAPKRGGFEENLNIFC